MSTDKTRQVKATFKRSYADITPIGKHEGAKYLREIYSAIDNTTSIQVDVYAVLEAFKITCPARQHAIKKLLCAGTRNNQRTAREDLISAMAALNRAIELEDTRERLKNGPEGFPVPGGEDLK